MDVSVESFQQWGRRRSQVHADNSRRASYASPVESTRLASPVQMERNSAGQAAKQRPERSDSDPASRVFASTCFVIPFTFPAG
jgi:hypothetical protein